MAWGWTAAPATARFPEDLRSQFLFGNRLGATRPRRGALVVNPFFYLFPFFLRGAEVQEAIAKELGLHESRVAIDASSTCPTSRLRRRLQEQATQLKYNGPSTKCDEDLMTIRSEFWLAVMYAILPRSRSRHGQLLRGDTRNAARR